MVSILSILFDIGLLGIFYGFTSLFYVYPAILSYRNFKKTGSRDYLLFSIIFILGIFIFFLASILLGFFQLSFHRIKLITWGRYPFITVGIYDMLYWSWLLCLSLHSLRLKWLNIPKIALATLLILYIYLMVDEFVFVFDLFSIRERRVESDPYAIYIRNPIATLLELYTAISLLFSYSTTQIEVETDRVINAKRIWKVASIIRILLASLFLFVLISNIRVAYFGNPPLFNPQTFTTQIYFSLRQTFQVSFALLIFLVAILYPESLLISQAQILRAEKLYAFVETSKKEALKSEDLSYIEGYMTEIYKLIREGGFPSDTVLPKKEISESNFTG